MPKKTESFSDWLWDHCEKAMRKHDKNKLKDVKNEASAI